MYAAINSYLVLFIIIFLNKSLYNTFKNFLLDEIDIDDNDLDTELNRMQIISPKINK